VPLTLISHSEATDEWGVHCPCLDDKDCPSPDGFIKVSMGIERPDTEDEYADYQFFSIPSSPISFLSIMNTIGVVLRERGSRAPSVIQYNGKGTEAFYCLLQKRYDNRRQLDPYGTDDPADLDGIRWWLQRARAQGCHPIMSDLSK